MTTGGMSTSRQRRIVGRYALYGELASGGMATVHFGRLLGPVGFARTVAIKRLHPHLARDPEFVAMFLDEARLVARIRHPNVVPTLDVVASDGELLLVMEYVQGESLGKLARAAAASGGVPLAVASAIFIGVLEGLHAAHEARSDRGEALDIVHRDVSPQNILVGEDGVAHVLDFGVAKAAGRLQETGEGQVKGKFAYMSPEQIAQLPVDCRTDVYAASVVLWETLTGRKLFEAESSASVVYAVVHQAVTPPSKLAPHIPPALDAVIMKGLSKRREERFATAHEMAVALEDAVAPATPRRVQEWVQTAALEALSRRARDVAAIESDSAVTNSNEDTSAKTVLAAVRDEMANSQRGSSPSHSYQGTVPPAERSVSKAEPLAAAAPGGSKRTVVAVALAAVSGVALALGFTIVTAKPPSPGAADAPPAPAPLGSPLGPSSGHPSADATGASPSAEAAASGVGVSGSAAQAPASASASTTGKRVGPATPTTARPSKPDCSNPFTIDPSGKKRPRPECF